MFSSQLWAGYTFFVNKFKRDNLIVRVLSFLMVCLDRCFHEKFYAQYVFDKQTKDAGYRDPTMVRYVGTESVKCQQTDIAAYAYLYPHDTLFDVVSR